MYWVTEWAAVRRDEVIDLPDVLAVHPDFWGGDREGFERGFVAAHGAIKSIYDAISRDPAAWRMPLFEVEEFHYGSKEARAARYAPWRPIDVLRALALSGEPEGGAIRVDAARFGEVCHVPAAGALIAPLSEMGFEFIGVKGSRFPKTGMFSVGYPDCPDVARALCAVARKAERLARDGRVSHDGPYADDFASWNWRLAACGADEGGYGEGADYVADRFHSAADRAFAWEFDRRMIETGHFRGRDRWNEGPRLCYYARESDRDHRRPYRFMLMSWKSEPRLYLRIRDADACAAHAEGASEAIREMFRRDEPGCHNRDHCKLGVHYIFEGVPRRHCGCCAAAFQIRPAIEDLDDYLALVELGENKR
ncbi:MAG: hypothetical protein GX558_09785 [Clostridiales bacterium]|nr:hypothetical protein [Clostridiales bacterium]